MSGHLCPRVSLYLIVPIQDARFIYPTAVAKMEFSTRLYSGRFCIMGILWI
jgi:hypothetical protein